MSEVIALAAKLPQKTYITMSCTIETQVLEDLDKLVTKVKKVHPKANRSQIINSIIVDKLTEFEL